MEIIKKITEFFKEFNFAGKIVLALLVLVAGLIMIGAIKKALQKRQQKLQVDRTLQVVARNVIITALYLLLALVIVEILGVPMTSIMALLASCGLAIGLSLQGALANLAGGLMILIFKPFKVGDYIETDGGQGTVRDINIFYTILITLDNKRISIPNGDLMNSSITNYSSEKVRRVDLDFKITNDCDSDLAQKVLYEAACSTNGIEREPQPFARMSAVDDDTFIFTVRVWCQADAYWDVYFDLLENCSKALNENGIDDPEERIAVRLVRQDD